MDEETPRAGAKARRRRARKRPVHLSADGWRIARSLYENDGLEFDAIARRMNVTVPTVTRHARDEAWLRAATVRDLIEAGDTPGLARMVSRLAKAFEHQISAIETQFRTVSTAGDGGARSDGGTLERNARTLGSLAKTLDVLIELRSGVASLDPTGGDEDALRRELAERLDRLCRRGAAAGVSGKPGPGRTDVSAP
ncbi:hypothetical protein [Stappia sp. ES.058]|uniref:hypothetical protein n=1 Tax=Stappia sp. ES.058 TaxID=1881061 RepID=UPI000B85FDF5|nr:hypothetical protein [Stappia sp. ES.058]